MGIIWGERLKLQITELHLGFCKFELHFDTLLLTVSVQFRSFTQLCATLCDPMASSTPGFPAHHQLPEFAQTLVRQFGEAIQPSHPLSFPSPAFSLSQHQGLFQ